jgi:hypothetical protein
MRSSIVRISNHRFVPSLILALATCFVACVRKTPAPTPLQALKTDRTVFTDTALFRRVCLEADSGLTPSGARCTPRDQGVRVR